MGRAFRWPFFYEFSDNAGRNDHIEKDLKKILFRIS
jgi:hypothetical protein